MVLKEKSQRFEPGLYICIFVKNSQWKEVYLLQIDLT